MRVVEDRIVYKDPRYYAAFTCVERCADGSLLTAFRCAPREPEIHHFHSQSKAVAVRSADGGRTWGEPVEIFPDWDLAQQDPHITRLPDGRILAMAFTWQAHPKCERSTLTDVYMELPEDKDVIMRCAGVITAESSDNGKSWTFLGKIRPSGAPRQLWACAAMHSRVAVLPDGTLLLPMRVEDGSGYYTYLVRSRDGGHSWEYVTEIIRDTSPAHHHYYDEAYIQRLADGRLVTELRCYDEGGLMEYCISADGGETWTGPVKSTVWGFPQTSARLSDGRIFLCYGYRREPFGVRARLVKADFSDVDTAEELVIYGLTQNRVRNFPVPGDLGYPSAAELEDGRVLVTYYCYDLNDRTSHIRAAVVDLTSE